MTIAATIQAAEIQAAATVKSTISAAIIGAIGIGFGVIASWYTALHLQRAARLAETRRDVYLEFSESFSNLIGEMGLIFINLDENWSSFINSISAINNKIDKILFVCEVQNKESIYIFDKLLGEKSNEFIAEMIPLKELSTKLSRLIDDCKKTQHQIDEIAIQIERKEFEGFPNTDKPTIDYFNELRKKNEKQSSDIRSIDEELKSLMISKSAYLKDSIKTLKEGFTPLSYKLRSELGAKTDIELDSKIYSNFYKR